MLPDTSVVGRRDWPYDPRVRFLTAALDDSVESGGTGLYIGSRRVHRTYAEAERALDGCHPDRHPIIIAFPAGVDLYDATHRGD